MPEDKMQREVHYDKDGRKYYTSKEEDEDQALVNRFWVGADGVKFYEADPITEEERKEAVEIWDAMSLPGTSEGNVEKKKKN